MSYRSRPLFHELRHLAREHRVILIMALIVPLIGATDYLLYWQDAAKTGGANSGLGLIAEASPWYVLIVGLAAYRMFALFRTEHRDAAWRTTPVSLKTLFLARTALLALLFVGWPMLVVGTVAHLTWPDSLAAQVFAVAIWMTFGLSCGAYLSLLKNGWWRLLGALFALRAVQLLMLCWGRGIGFNVWDSEIPNLSPLWIWMLLAGFVTLPLGAVLHLKLKPGRVRFISELTVFGASFALAAALPVKIGRMDEAQVVRKETEVTERFTGTATNIAVEYWSGNGYINRPMCTMQVAGVNDHPGAIIESMQITRVTEIANTPDRTERPFQGEAPGIHAHRNRDRENNIPITLYIRIDKLIKSGLTKGVREIKLYGKLTQSFYQSTPVLKTSKLGDCVIDINNQQHHANIQRRPESHYSTLNKSTKAYEKAIYPPQWTVNVDTTQIFPWFGITVADARLLGFDRARITLTEKKSQTALNSNDHWSWSSSKRPLMSKTIDIPSVCELKQSDNRGPVEVSLELCRVKSIITSPFELTLKLPDEITKVTSAKTTP